jgi:O-antigen ligase
MRFYFGWLAFISMAVYAWWNWILALCFLIVSMAVVERPDFPKSSIPGLSAWNLLFLSVVAAYFFKYAKSTYTAVLPPKIKRYLWYYLFFILLAFAREVVDYQGINDYLAAIDSRAFVNPSALFNDDVINTLKYAVPGILCYYAAEDRKSILRILAAVIGLNLVLALLVIKDMPIDALTDGRTLEQTGIRKIDRDIGYYRSDLAILFAGAAWVVYMFRAVATNWFLKQCCTVGSFTIVLAMALTGGRIGQGAWLVVGAVVAYFRWRRLLVIGPLIVVLIVSMVPAVRERFLAGVATDSSAVSSETDAYSVTSGRNEIWPYVIDRIGDAPLIGYGRRSMQRIGLSQWLGDNLGEPFPHPHNAYLELFLDNGVILGLPILLFYFLLLRRSFVLFRDARNELYVLVGGSAFALMLAQLVGFLGLLSFYPYTSSVSLWCAMGLALRLYQEREMLDKTHADHAQLHSTTILAATQ